MKHDKILYEFESDGNLPKICRINIPGVGTTFQIEVARESCDKCHGTGSNAFLDGPQLRKIREEQKAARKQVAKAMKIGDDYLYQLERNFRPFTIERTVRYLTAIYKISGKRQVSK